MFQGLAMKGWKKGKGWNPEPPPPQRVLEARRVEAEWQRTKEAQREEETLRRVCGRDPPYFLSILRHRPRHFPPGIAWVTGVTWLAEGVLVLKVRLPFLIHRKITQKRFQTSRHQFLLVMILQSRVRRKVHQSFHNCVGGLGQS